MNQLVNIENAVKCIETKLNSSLNLNYSTIHSDSLANGLAELRRMYNVSLTNPMIFSRYPFWKELSCIVTNQYVHRPPNEANITTNVLLIGIGYSEALRDHMMSENHPIKHAHV